jgi:CheY-like chemotaxis protein
VNGEALVILLVEDNQDHTELVMRSFQDHRIANMIYHVTDGDAALNYLFRRGAYADPKKSPKPDVVLLDLRLPKIDGLEVLNEIKTEKHLACIPVVILTTSEAEEDVATAYDCHANSYLVKPIDFDKFTQLINDLGLYWLAWNHKPWNRSINNRLSDHHLNIMERSF